MPLLLIGGMMAAGWAVSTYGNVLANRAQAKAEEENARYLEEQAGFTREAGRRAQQIFDDEAEQTLGNQISGYSAGGVTLSGSPLSVLADSLGRQVSEKAAIKKDFFAKEREALLKAGASYKQAQKLRSWKTNFLPAAGSGLSTAGSVANSNSAQGSSKSASSQPAVGSKT